MINSEKFSLIWNKQNLVFELKDDMYSYSAKYMNFCSLPLLLNEWQSESGFVLTVTTKLGEILPIFIESKLATKEYSDTTLSIYFPFLTYIGLSPVLTSPVIDK